MNQILATKPVKKGKKVQIKTVKTFFGISIIIFGIGLITSGSYAIFTNKDTQIQEQAYDNTSYSDIDTTFAKPKNEEIQIQLSVDGSKIKASIVGETEIAYVTYKIDDNEESREDINSVSGTVNIEIPEGKHILTITAVDINNNTKTQEREVEGRGGNQEDTSTEDSQNNDNQTSKPKLNVKHDKETSEFVIDASDEKGLDRLEFILNGQGYLVRVEGAKEKQFRYPLIEGDNTLEVTAYNTDGETEVFRALIHN